MSGCPVDRFGETEIFESPYAYYDTLREEAPVFYSDTLKAFVVSRIADAQAILEKPERFLSTPAANQTSVMARHSRHFHYLYEEAGTPLPMATLVAIDGADHTRYRKLVAPLFSPTAVRNLESPIRSIINELIDSFIHAGRVDIYKEFCLKLPLFVICDLLGLPRSAVSLMKSAADASMDLVGAGILTEEQKVAAHREVIRLNLYLQPFIAAARRNPGKNLIGHLASVNDGQPLSDREIIAFVQTLNLGGNETTTNGLGNTLLTLIQNPGYEQRLREDRILIPKFIEECLRLECPINSAHRWAKEDAQIGGVQVPAGSCLHVRIPAANRDPDKYRNPGELDLTRPTIRDHVAFGAGIHYCLGAVLARSELNIALDVILDRLRELRLDPAAGPLSHHRRTQIRGVTALPVIFTRAAV